MGRMPKQDKPKGKKRLNVVPSRADEGILGKGGKCNSLKRDGKNRCTLDAGHGTEHPGYGACSYHGGNSPSLNKHAVKAQVLDLAQELDMDPHDALLFTVRLAAGVVKWLRDKIGELEDPDDTITAVDKAANAAILQMYMDQYGAERDRLAKAAKLAIDAGIDERRIAMEEDQGEAIAKAFQGVFADLNLTAEQKRSAPAIVRKHLTLLMTA